MNCAVNVVNRLDSKKTTSFSVYLVQAIRIKFPLVQFGCTIKARGPNGPDIAHLSILPQFGQNPSSDY